MSGCGAKNTISELVLAAVFHLQQRNGVSVMEIAEYIGEKHCCNPCKIRRQVKVTLNKAKEHGIMSESKGRYRIEGKYEDKLDKEELRPRKNGDDEDNGNGKDDVCVAFDDEEGGGHEHDDREGQKQENKDKFEDCLKGGGAREEGEELDCEDDGNDAEFGEPVSKKRRTYAKIRDNYTEEKDEDSDSGSCVLKALRDMEEPYNL